MNGEQGGAERPKKVRAFIALKTPPGWDEQFAELQKRLKLELRSDGIRWVKPEQIHVTLRFLGSIRPEEAERVGAMLPRISDGCRPFRLRCEGLGCFPNLRRPRVLWAGLTGEVERVQTLQGAVTDVTREIGEPPEEREFKPHLTLARIQNVEKSAAEKLQGLIDLGFAIGEEWGVSEVLLMRSHLSQAGARYETIARGSFR